MTLKETSATTLELSAQEAQILLTALDKLPVQGLETMLHCISLGTRLQEIVGIVPLGGSHNGTPR